MNMIRTFDILFSGLALLILSPFLIPLMILLKYSGEGEIFYVQKRIGLSGKCFGVLKFATMLKNSPSMGTGVVTVKNDPRILPMGQFLRKSKINELPQIINIFKGDMSFIGPRPLVPDVFNAYSESVKESIATVSPGLSGIGSIVFRDEESLLDDRYDAVEFHRNVIGEYKGRLEAWFVTHRNLRVYMISIFLTVWAVIFPKNQLIWKIFPSLPQPEGELGRLLGVEES